MREKNRERKLLSIQVPRFGGEESDRAAWKARKQLRDYAIPGRKLQDSSTILGASIIRGRRQVGLRQNLNGDCRNL